VSQFEIGPGAKIAADRTMVELAKARRFVERIP
jgi:hypothetical protein